MTEPARSPKCFMRKQAPFDAMATTTRAEKAYKRHAWMLLFPAALAILAFGITFLVSGSPLRGEVQLVTGMTWDELVTKSPGIASLFMLRSRIEGLSEVAFSIFGMGIAAIPYRKGDRWAWYVSWLLPTFLLGDATLDATSGVTAFLAVPILLAIITVGGLFLPYRKFFPRRPA